VVRTHYRPPSDLLAGTSKRHLPLTPRVLPTYFGISRTSQCRKHRLARRCPTGASTKESGPQQGAAVHTDAARKEENIQSVLSPSRHGPRRRCKTRQSRHLSGKMGPSASLTRPSRTSQESNSRFTSLRHHRDMTTTPHSSFIIVGLTIAGRKFRPSDWAERLCGVLSAFGAEKRMRYSPYVGPRNYKGEKSRFRGWSTLRRGADGLSVCASLRARQRPATDPGCCPASPARASQPSCCLTGSSTDPSELRPELSELLLDPFVTPVEMVNALYQRLPLRYQASDDQTG
jgi:hypothetical protein